MKDKDHTACPVCRHAVTTAFLSREQVPVHQNLVFRHQEDAQRIPRGALHLHVCEACGFVFNTAFEEAKLNYSIHYNNNQSYSDRFDQHTREMADRILEQLSAAQGTVVEVGCGKGDFIRQLFRMHEGLTGYGFDPSYEGQEDAMDGRLAFVRDFYGPPYAHISADVVVCRHVIEHIADPVALLRTIRTALEASPHAKVYFETPCVEWILQHVVVCDFFYEHCSYFSSLSLSQAFEQAGFQVEQVSHVFGGQYLWLEASLRTGEEVEGTAIPSNTAYLARSYQREEQAQIAHWRKQLTDYSEHGPVAIWGAGAKGVTYLNVLDPQIQLVPCVIDINPAKQGGYLPGTGHEITSVNDLAQRGIQTVIMMNPNYTKEVEQMLSDRGLALNLIELEGRM